MQKLQISKSLSSPEIILSPDERIFIISGISSPEDVREFYYPVLGWMKSFSDDLLKDPKPVYNSESPLKLQINLSYFNSSSAKFLYDIIMELKKLRENGIPVIVEWQYDADDNDMKEAGLDFSYMADMEFSYLPKNE
jgi:hypothetical protein